MNNKFINQFLPQDVRYFFNILKELKEKVNDIQEIYIDNYGHSCDDPNCDHPFDPRIECIVLGNIDKDLIKTQVINITKMYYEFIRIYDEKDEEDCPLKYETNYKNKDILKFSGFLQSDVNWFFKDIQKLIDEFKVNFYINDVIGCEWGDSFEPNITIEIPKELNKLEFENKINFMKKYGIIDLIFPEEISEDLKLYKF